MNILVNSRVDFFEKSRHAYHYGRTGFLHIFYNLVGTFTESHMTTRHQRRVVACRAFKDMAQRQEAEERLILAKGFQLLQAIMSIIEHVAMGEHNPFGNPRGSGGIDDCEQVCRLNCIDTAFDFAAFLLGDRTGVFR